MPWIRIPTPSASPRPAAGSSARARTPSSGWRATRATSRSPPRSLFQEIRYYFPITEQARVYYTIEHYLGLAAEFIREEIERSGEGAVVPCRATTRKGKPCQRTPLPGREYCPSHAHLEEKVPAIREGLRLLAARARAGARTPSLETETPSSRTGGGRSVSAASSAWTASSPISPACSTPAAVDAERLRSWKSG